jgi:hypothetical protein
MPWDYKVYLDDILQAITRIREYAAGLSPTAFAGDAKTLRCCGPKSGADWGSCEGGSGGDLIRASGSGLEKDFGAT